jgi:signal transduction histidine kinase
MALQLLSLKAISQEPRIPSGEIVAVYQDVTRVKLAQKALEESEQRFRDLVENSLTGISIVQQNKVVYQNQAQERLLGPLPRSYLLMDFAKPGEPKLTLIDLNLPVTEAINLSAVTMRKSGIVLEKVLSENLPPCNADPTLIEEMVLNLLNNAAGAMERMAEGKKILVTSFVEDDGIILTVSDSGPGIASEIRDKIFDPYFTTKSDGTGIGLSISHRIVTDHGGSLAVSDSELGGAEFRIEIPIKHQGAKR